MLQKTAQAASSSGQWPEDLSFKAFEKVSLASENWVYKTVYALRRDQIKIQNERIALTKLRKILRATFKLTSSVSFHSMSLRELSKESGISMGGLYSYIGSKEELANLIEHVLRAITLELTEMAIKDITDTKTKLAAFMCSHIYLSEQLQPWFYFVFMESKTLSKEQIKKAKQNELDYEQRIQEMIQDGIDQGVFETSNTQLAAGNILALLQDWHLKDWKYGPRGTTPDEYTEQLLETVWSMLKA